MMIDFLEAETIRRIGELIKGIGKQLTDYAEKKKEQLDASAQQRDKLLNASKLPMRSDNRAAGDFAMRKHG